MVEERAKEEKEPRATGSGVYSLSGGSQRGDIRAVAGNVCWLGASV